MNKPIITIFLLVISVIVVVLFAVPEYRQAKGLQLKLATAKAQYQGQADYLAAISRLADELDARPDALNKVDSALPTGFSVAPIISFLGNTATTHSLAIQSVELSPEALAPYAQMLAEESKIATQSMAFSVRITGPYRNIRNFIAAIENSARVFEITAVSAKPAPAVRGITAKTLLYEVALEVITHAY